VRNEPRTTPWKHTRDTKCSLAIRVLDTKRKSVVSFMHRSLHTQYPLDRTGWAPAPVWTLWRREKTYATGNGTAAVQPEAFYYTDCASKAPIPSIVLCWNWAKWSNFRVNNIEVASKRSNIVCTYRRKPTMLLCIHIVLHRTALCRTGMEHATLKTHFLEQIMSNN
jgi:hypothetical protein